jgi:hypothetical protein
MEMVCGAAIGHTRSHERLPMRRREALTGIAVITAGCGGSNGPTAAPPAAQVRNVSSQMTLYPGSWQFGVAPFDAGPGDVTVVVRIDAPVALVWAVGLRFAGTTPVHDEGGGGAESQGPGPLLTGRWRVGFTGRYEAFVYLPSRLPPLPVPETGLIVPLAFTITHA